MRATPNAGHSLGSIPLTHCFLIDYMPIDRGLGFNIHTPERRWELFACDSQERLAWCNTIAAACAPFPVGRYHGPLHVEDEGALMTSWQERYAVCGKTSLHIFESEQAWNISRMHLANHAAVTGSKPDVDDVFFGVKGTHCLYSGESCNGLCEGLSRQVFR